ALERTIGFLNACSYAIEIKIENKSHHPRIQGAHLFESLSRWGGGCPACQGRWQPLLSDHQDGGQQQQASGIREKAAGGAATHRGAGATPAEDAPGARQDISLSESSFQEQNRLAIQVEENDMLKAALGSALRGKEEDFRMYHETLGQVKGVFLKALRQQKAEKH
uniref:Coiled-coil domain containing 13 n=1 Tax=Rhinolophus ferrumequinum TaxID=59479 RepID=A0A671FGE4_RHIFE